MAVFENIDFNFVVDSFADIGGFDVVLPFLLVFAVTFAVLTKIKLFGDKKKIDVLVSLILAAFLISATDIVELLVAFLPRVSMIILVLLMLILAVGVFSGGSEWGGGWLLMGAIVAIIAVLWALGAAAEWDVPLLEDITEQDIGTLIVIGVFVLVIWLIVREPKSGGSFLDSLEKLVGGLKGGKSGR
ncbi:hypothetical protein HYT56_00830 [Candidatus Woesearchaeota archaeon]|nr:hypothetical protein [Candidatus Woesearchaeota archaeon]